VEAPKPWKRWVPD